MSKFRSPFLTGPVNTVFDVDPKDGQRFIGSTAPDSSSLPLNVITNWTAQLTNKVARMSKLGSRQPLTR
jgi:hypothetical protein